MQHTRIWPWNEKEPLCDNVFGEMVISLGTKSWKNQKVIVSYWCWFSYLTQSQMKYSVLSDKPFSFTKPAPFSSSEWQTMICDSENQIYPPPTPLTEPWASRRLCRQTHCNLFGDWEEIAKLAQPRVIFVHAISPFRAHCKHPFASGKSCCGCYCAHWQGSLARLLESWCGRGLIQGQAQDLMKDQVGELLWNTGRSRMTLCNSPNRIQNFWVYEH